MYELKLTRLIDASCENVFRCWTDPDLIPKWFCPPPWGVSKAEVDLRAGGSSLIVMRGPNGEEVPNPGIYLEVVPNEKLVFTDAYSGDWEPSGKPFMTGILTFEEEGGKTRYTARVRHWTEEDLKQHEAMGFEQGWGIATDQLEALAKTL
ncbi:MAG: polyketide cyclase [Sphingomonadales bacterium]|nr:MAG: polyketide cyclase [Sphingomonadales bacterium]